MNNNRGKYVFIKFYNTSWENGKGILSIKNMFDQIASAYLIHIYILQYSIHKKNGTLHVTQPAYKHFGLYLYSIPTNLIWSFDCNSYLMITSDKAFLMGLIMWSAFSFAWYCPLLPSLNVWKSSPTSIVLCC